MFEKIILDSMPGVPLIYECPFVCTVYMYYDATAVCIIKLKKKDIFADVKHLVVNQFSRPLENLTFNI